jgi:NADPH:quinone reductase-like Zn-dependent oxidoreductase
MKAVVYHSDGLRFEEIEKPAPADNEVLIKVRAASLNALDSHLLEHPFLRRVLSAVSKSKLTRPGRDVAGEVEAVGSKVTRFKPGDAVFGCGNGTCAEYVCAPESGLVIKPESLSFEQTAAVGVAGLTALQGLRDYGELQPGQKVLINGAASGVGTFAVQIAKSLGAEVSAVCSTRNLEMVRAIGADRVFDYTREDFATSGEHYDLILDLVSNHSFSEDRRVLNPKGTYIGAGVLGLNSLISLLSRKIVELVMSPFVTQRFVSLMAKLKKEDLTILSDLMTAGKVTPVIDRSYSLSEGPEAVRYLAGKHARGKVVVVVGPQITQID